MKKIIIVLMLLMIAFTTTSCTTVRDPQKYIDMGFSRSEAELIAERKIRIGMSRKALIQSWGIPSDLNTTVTRYGRHEQFVYGTYTAYSSPTYVYVDDGVVTSWQK